MVAWDQVTFNVNEIPNPNKTHKTQQKSGTATACRIKHNQTVVCRMDKGGGGAATDRQEYWQRGGVKNGWRGGGRDSKQREWGDDLGVYSLPSSSASSSSSPANLS